MPIHNVLAPHRAAIKAVLEAIETFSRDGKIFGEGAHKIQGLKALCWELARVELGPEYAEEEYLLVRRAVSLRRQWYRWKEADGHVPSARRLAVILSHAKAKKWYPPKLAQSPDVEQLHSALDREARIQRDQFRDVAKNLRVLSRDFDDLEENNDSAQMEVLGRLAQCTPWAIAALEGCLRRLRLNSAVSSPVRGAFAHNDVRLHTMAALSAWTTIADRLGKPSELKRVRLFPRAESDSDDPSDWLAPIDEPPTFDEEDEDDGSIYPEQAGELHGLPLPKRKRGRPRKAQ